MSNESSEPAARVFVSYAHADNDLHSEAIGHFCDDLKGFFFSETGRQLDIFFDHKSIGWGDDWRSSIESALIGATIFMPIVTMQYFMRDACRDELNAFNANAQRLNANYLILPIVIAGAAKITSDDPRPEVRLIESLQFRNHQTAFLAGRGTREWREALQDIADKLYAAIDRAEREISLSPATTAGQASGSQTGGEADESDTDLLELFSQLQELVDKATGETSEAVDNLTAWGGELTSQLEGQRLEGMTSDQARIFCIRLASQISEPSIKIQDSGTRLSETISLVDANLRGMLEDLRSLNVPELQSSVSALVGQLETTFGDNSLSQTADQMTTFLEQMKVMEVFSSPLRRALRPARTGIERFRDAVRVMDGWSNLADGL